jgi:hypothetical protein
MHSALATARTDPTLRSFLPPAAPTDVQTFAALPVWREAKPYSNIIELYPRQTAPDEAVAEGFRDPEEQREELPSREDRLYGKLLSFKDLPAGWDGYNAPPARLDAIVEAIDFLAARPDDIPLPYAQLSADGEVGLYWKTDDVFADIGFYGNGEYSFYARVQPKGGAPEEFWRDQCQVARSWNDDLLKVLNRISRAR